MTGAGGDLLDAVGNIGAPDGIILLDRGSVITKVESTPAQSTSTPKQPQQVTAQAAKPEVQTNNNVGQKVNSASASNTEQIQKKQPVQRAKSTPTQTTVTPKQPQQAIAQDAKPKVQTNNNVGQKVKSASASNTEQIQKKQPVQRAKSTPTQTTVTSKPAVVQAAKQEIQTNINVGQKVKPATASSTEQIQTKQPVQRAVMQRSQSAPINTTMPRRNSATDIFPRQRFCDPSMVEVSGPGVENGILSTYQSAFLVEMDGAGRGRLQVSIRGPEGILLPYMNSCTQNIKGWVMEFG